MAFFFVCIFAASVKCGCCFQIFAPLVGASYQTSNIKNQKSNIKHQIPKYSARAAERWTVSALAIAVGCCVSFFFSCRRLISAHTAGAKSRPYPLISFGPARCCVPQRWCRTACKRLTSAPGLLLWFSTYYKAGMTYSAPYRTRSVPSISMTDA